MKRTLIAILCLLAFPLVMGASISVTCGDEQILVNGVEICADNTNPPPPPPPPLDSDGDGIPDSEDQCPLEAGPASNNGCPVVEPPPPPPPPPPGDTPYDLGDVPGTITAPNWPESPGISFETVVRNDTELQNALIPGSKIIIEAGSYGSVTLTAADHDMIFEVSPDAVFSDSFFWGNGSDGGPQRIEWHGGTLRGQYGFDVYGTDILIDNVNHQGSGAGLRPRPGLKRLAVINSTFKSWNMFTVLAGSAAGNRREDLIFANIRSSIVDSGNTHSPFRISGATDRIVVVDSYFERTMGNHGGVRLQYDVRDVWFARNVVNATGSALTDGRNLLRMDVDPSRQEFPAGPAVIDANHFYTNVSTPWTIGSNDQWMIGFEFTGNRHHTASCTNVCGSMNVSQPGMDNLQVSVGTLPTASQYGADH